MNLKIAIQPDEIFFPDGTRQSFSERWTELARGQDIEAVPVDVFSRDVMTRISACDAFMWRCDTAPYPRLFAQRLLHAVEAGLGVPVFPSLKGSWYYEDKVSQFYFLSLAGIPTPATEVFWTRQQAEQFCQSATYPFVLKLANGYQGSNVRLVCDRDEALFYVGQLFGPGIASLGYRHASRVRLLLRRLRAAADVVKGFNPNGSPADAELQYGYLYVQEFLPGNEFDVRVIVVGNRALAFRRFIRPDDFRASGSGRRDSNPGKIGEDAIRLTYRLARQLGTQAVAADILRRGSQPVIGEFSPAFPIEKGVRECKGHWILRGEPESGALEWMEGAMRPEDAIFTDFVSQVRHSTAATGLLNV